MVKNPPANAGDLRDPCSIPRSGRSPGGRHGNLLQYSCPENPMDRGAWQLQSMGYKELDMTEVLRTHAHYFCLQWSELKKLNKIPLEVSVRISILDTMTYF